jgi:tetratricopeptide (TPR) repeat protein
LDTTDSAALFTLGRLFFQAKQYSNASRYFHTYVRRFPTSPEGWELYMESLYLSRQYKEAKEAAEKVRQSAPNSTKALAVTGHAQYELKEHDKAIQTFQQLAKLDTLGLENEMRLGKAYAANKQDSLAIVTLEKVVRADPTQVELYSDLGAAYMRMRKWDKAVGAFRMRIKSDPNNTSAYVNYALSAMAIGQWDSARVALKKATELRPDYLPGHLYLARALAGMDSLQVAKKEYEMVVQLADTAVIKYRVELADAHSMIGAAYLLDRKYPQALESLNTSVRFKNDNAQARLWRAQTLALMNRRDEAIAEYRVVLKLDPKNKTAKENLEQLGVQ